MLFILGLSYAFILKPNSLLNYILLKSEWKNDFLIWRGVRHMLICHLAFFKKSLTLNELVFGVDLLNCAYPNWYRSEMVSEDVCDCRTVTQVFCGELREGGHLPWSRTKPTWSWLSAWVTDHERGSCRLSDPSTSAFPITVRQNSPHFALFSRLPCVFS